MYFGLRFFLRKYALCRLDHDTMYSRFAALPYRRGDFSQRCPKRFHSLLENGLRIFARTAENEGPKVLIPVAVWCLRFSDDPIPQPLQIVEGDRPVGDAFQNVFS